MYPVIPIMLVVCAFCLICLYGLWHRSYCLEQQLQSQQQQMEQTFTKIHNGPLQVLAFLMREIQCHEMPTQDVLQHLSEVYQDVQLGVQPLQDRQSHHKS
jgi:hypothetical protein